MDMLPVEWIIIGRLVITKRGGSVVDFLAVLGTSHSLPHIITVVFMIGISIALIESLAGHRIQEYLWEHDKYSQPSICPRIYGIALRVCVFLLLLSVLIVTFLERDYGISCLFACVTIGYGIICYNTYGIRITYANACITFRKHRKKRIIAWEQVSSIRWRSEKKDMCYELIIQLNTGEIITLSQSVFVGLRNMEEFYEQQKKP